MSRTKSNRKSQQQEQQAKYPEATYKDLSVRKKKICYNFWIYQHTNGERGWDPLDVPGAIWRWKSSEEFKLNIPKGSWRYMAIVSMIILFVF